MTTTPSTGTKGLAMSDPTLKSLERIALESSRTVPEVRAAVYTNRIEPTLIRTHQFFDDTAERQILAALGVDTADPRPLEVRGAR